MPFNGHDDKHRSLAEAFEDQVFVLNRDFCYDYVNASAAHLLGVGPEKVIGTSPEDWFQPEDAATQKSAVRRVFETGESSYHEEPLRIGGRRLWLSTRLVPVRSGGDTVTAVLGLSRDISERREVEARLHDSQKMEAIGRLAGGVAHDFNNLLTAILGYIELLHDELPAGSSLRADAEEVRTAARRAAELTQQLLAFGRRQALRPETLDLNVRVRSIEKMLRRLIGESVEITLDLTEGLWLTRADPGQLDQVILNLAVNARDALPDGGRLTIATANVDGLSGGSTADSGVRDSRFVELSMSDTGKGMDAATRERLFEPFFTTKEQGRGAGLGLATVYGIVKQSGGHIQVDSRPGSGTTFRMWFPQVEAADRAATAVEKPAVVTARGETVLLVEDEDAVRSLASRALSRLGYRVLEARNGEVALALASSEIDSIAVLVTDVVMPGLSGPALAAALVRGRPSMAVVYMSGYTDRVDPGVGVIGGPQAELLTKPFSPSELGAAVRRALDG